MKQFLETGDGDLESFKKLHIGDWIKVYQSPKMTMSSKMSTFPYIKISSSKLCGGNMNLPIKVSLLNFKANGSHKWKGEFLCKASDLGDPNKAHNFFNNRKNKSAGQLYISKFHKELNYKFADYLRGGTSISVITCIDFTGSNGIPTQPSSLHYVHPHQLNQYQHAITSVCSILEKYDEDGNINVYGFGAKPRFPMLNLPQTSHFFPCSGDFNSPAGKGVNGVF